MLRLANPSKRVSQNVFHYVQSAKHSLAINLNPIEQSSMNSGRETALQKVFDCFDVAFPLLNA